MVTLQLYDEGTVITVFIPIEFAHLSLHELYEKQLIFVEVK